MNKICKLQQFSWKFNDCLGTFQITCKIIVLYLFAKYKCDTNMRFLSKIIKII